MTPAINEKTINKPNHARIPTPINPTSLAPVATEESVPDKSTIIILHYFFYMPAMDTDSFRSA